jgi:hypothetical protein
MDDSLDPDLLQVDVSRERGATVVAVVGELDAATTPDLQGPLASSSTPPGCTRSSTRAARSRAAAAASRSAA